MANGRAWSREDIANLYKYAETMSQQKAAKKLGRTVFAVARKSNDLGIEWRQGYSNYMQIARRVGCSPTTVKRLVAILYPDGIPSYGSGTGIRFMIEHEDVERIVRVLRGNLKHRYHKVNAGKIRQSRQEEK